MAGFKPDWQYILEKYKSMKFKKTIFMILLIGISLDSHAQEVTRVAVVGKPIKYVYRVVLESLNKCVVPGINWSQYSGAYFDDNQTASILSSVEAKGFGDSYKLKKIDENQTEISYFKSRCLFCTIAAADATFNKTLKWIDDGDRDCQSSESSSTKAVSE